MAELPGAFGGAAAHLVANALAAAAACRAAGFSAKDIRRGLATFTPVQANPGRGNVYQAGDVPVIVDYGHNAAALDATGAMITKVWGGEPAAAITLPGDRRDDLITETAEAVAAWFGKVVVYEDSDKRGRRPGEMQELITGGHAPGAPGHCLRARRRAGAGAAPGCRAGRRRPGAVPLREAGRGPRRRRVHWRRVSASNVSAPSPGRRPVLALRIPLPAPGCG